MTALDIANALLSAPTRWSAAAQRQLAGARFTAAGCAGELSLDITTALAAPLLPSGHPPALIEAEGADALGRRSTVALRAASGRITRLEVIPIDSGAALPLPGTLRQLDPVRRGGDVVWLVPRPHAILGQP